MGKDSGSAPTPPDYATLARMQGNINQQASREQTQANRVNQVNPYGSLTWTNTPTMSRQFDTDAYNAALDQWSRGQSAGSAPPQYINSGGSGENYDISRTQLNPAYTAWAQNQGVGAPNKEDFYRDMPTDNWTQTVTLSPERQAMLNQQTSMQQNLLNQAQGNLSQSFDMSSLPGIHNLDLSQLTAMPDSGFGAVQQVQDAMMGRLQSGLDRGRAAEIQRLKSQGITEGSPAWQASMQSLGQKDNDANQQALLGAMGAYGDIFNRGIASRQQGLAEQSLLYNTSANDRARAYSEAMQNRLRPLSELSALNGGSQIAAPSFDAYTQATGYTPANIYGGAQDAYNAQLGQYNANRAQSSANSAAGASTGAAVGSIFGPIGTVVGGLFGGLLG